MNRFLAGFCLIHIVVLLSLSLSGQVVINIEMEVKYPIPIDERYSRNVIPEKAAFCHFTYERGKPVRISLLKLSEFDIEENLMLSDLFRVIFMENEEDLILTYDFQEKTYFLTEDGKKYRKIDKLVRNRYGSLQRYLHLYAAYKKLQEEGILIKGGRLVSWKIWKKMNVKKTLIYRDKKYSEVMGRCKNAVIIDEAGKKIMYKNRYLKKDCFIVFGDL